MKLNETFGRDLTTFFHPDEFGMPAILDGKPVLIVLDDDSLKEYNFKAEGEGLAIGELLFHVPVISLDQKPFIGKRILVDGKHYEMIDIKENLGVYTIISSGYHS